MICLVEVLLLLFSLSFIIMNKVINFNPEPIFNIYQRPNGFYWLKVIIIFSVLYIRKVIHQIKLFFKSRNDLNEYYEQLERPQKLSNHEQPIDAIYFNAANKNGDHLVLGTARRKGLLIDGFIYLKINDEKVGLLENLKLPDTSLYQEKQTEEWSSEGIRVECIEAMKKWKIVYSGKMKKHTNPKEILNIELDVMYTSNLPFFNFDTDMDCYCMAKCIALEKWSREYFNLLKEHHQTHYEQHGNLKGQVIIEDKIFPINMDSMRDHTFGNHREWRNLHKYNLEMFATENGDRFTIGSICFPLTISSFQMGYVYSARDQKYHPITYNDFQLYQHGESGTPPTDYAYTIKAGGKVYIIKVDVVDSPHFFISKDWESKVTERLSSFKVNGLRGWGASEWQQRNILGRNICENKKKCFRVQDINQRPVRRLIGEESTELFEKMLKT